MKSEKNSYLRGDLAYTSRSGSNLFYYIAIIENSLLRFIWIPQFLLMRSEYFSNASIFAKTALSTAILFLEMLRRFIWNFLRLENEHFNNCGEFRTVRTKILEKRINFL
ncbi:Oidioi.mRNA.OKI2018_I69.XSR.g15658.t1.cds [Oikopleura dioica]|uniref:Oidioi.mRNA.OKI2018_I69.XSR.g15658.t1.cds n=1 Tax=Oikopleura dioica TaxID=34765 RepID=A0ABN7SJY4_OIKDI|nr:Oidioi.mRNA.OKI2018_I69.XSR.g15658.t1.cds [Oikopleura dioica]